MSFKTPAVKPFDKIFLLLLLINIYSFSQEINDDRLLSAYSQQEILNDFNENDNLLFLKSNSIFIEQIGDYNNINSIISSEKSKVKLFQIGSYNEINYTVSALYINDFVFQYGNNNSFSIHSFRENTFQSIKVIQNGENQNLTWLGANLISEKLKITMQGYSQSLTVLNY